MPPTNVRVNSRLRARRGVTLPLVVLLLAVFIGVTSFAIDVSRMFVIKAELQTAADAGAISGGMQLAHGLNASARDSAFTYTQVNLTEKVTPTVGAGDIEPGHWADGSFSTTPGWLDPSTNAIRVTTHHEGSYLFGPIYNVFSSLVSARAVVAVGSVRGTDCVRPLAIPYTNLLKALGKPLDVTYNLTDDDVLALRSATTANALSLKLGDPAAVTTSGNYYAVREPPIQYADGTAGNPWQGGSDYRNALGGSCGNLPFTISKGDWLLAENGNMVGPTQQGVGDFCGGSGKTFSCSGNYVIPIWDVASKDIAAPMSFHVKYVGVFRLTGYADGSIIGYFHTMAANGYYDPDPGIIQRPALVH